MLLRWFKNTKFSQVVYKEMCSKERGEFVIRSLELKGSDLKSRIKPLFLIYDFCTYQWLLQVSHLFSVLKICQKKNKLDHSNESVCHEDT